MWTSPLLAYRVSGSIADPIGRLETIYCSIGSVGGVNFKQSRTGPLPTRQHDARLSESGRFAKSNRRRACLLFEEYRKGSADIQNGAIDPRRRGAKPCSAL